MIIKTFYQTGENWNEGNWKDVGHNQGVWRTEIPSGVQRQSPWWGLGAKPPETGVWGQSPQKLNRFQ